MKKLLALLLVALTLVPMIVACQDSTEQPSVTTDGGTMAPGETADPYETGVPKQDFNEWEFKFMTPWPDHWGKDNYNIDEDTGDTILTQVYTRNRYLEDYFNITITSFTAGYTSSQFTELQPFIMAGTDDIDVLAGAFTQSGRQLITMDLITSWNDVPYINLEKPWWQTGVTETLAILGNYYFLVGDLNWFYMPETAVCYFNKVVAEQNKEIVGDLYQTVRDGKWTLDYTLNLAKQFSKENGDGKWDEQDTYGALQNQICGTVGFFYASNIEFCTLTDDGPKFKVVTKKVATLLEKAGELVGKNNISYIDSFDFVEDSKAVPIFFDNRALLYFDILIRSMDFRDKESDYGIIPYPKYDEAQKNYVTYSDQWSLSCALPRTATDLNRTGSILEEMSALSRKLIVPAYYDRTLIGKGIRDDESEEMLNIIFSNILYDFDKSFGLGAVPNQLLWTGSTAVASHWRKTEKISYLAAWDLYSHVYKQVHGVEPQKPADAPA